MRLSGGLRSFSLVIVSAMAVSGCDNDISPPKPTTQEMVEECSPFKSFNNKKEIDLDFEGHKVVLSEVANSQRNRHDDNIDTAKDIQKTSGTFELDELNNLVHIRLDGQNFTYLLAEPGDQSQCLLINGTPEAANLSASWFGTPVDDPPDPPDPND